MTSSNSVEQAIQRLRESKPPATDHFTYLTIIEKSLSPEVLPALQEILEDVELTGEIGWDLVEMLIGMPGSEECLGTIARLGNPREVILKVLQVMDSLAVKGGEAEAEAIKAYVTLCGMLAILHARLKVKAPSRFLHTTLETVYRCYNAASAEATAAVIALVRSMSGEKRPPLPTRQSSTLLDTTLLQSDAASSSAPDPEADGPGSPGAKEPEMQTRLLQAFVTCVIEAYVNLNDLEWAPRLMEFTYPEKIVPGKRTRMQAFKEDEELQARDALVGQLVAAAGDLDLPHVPLSSLKQILREPVCREPFLADKEVDKPEDIELSTGGLLCLLAYCIFAGEVFDADRPRPDMHMFPEHHVLMRKILGEEEAERHVADTPGTVEALLVMAIWLDGQQRIGQGSSQAKSGEGPASDFMDYHHLVTLVSVFHPNLRVRNAATVVAGAVLRADPDEEDRMTILEDLLENCMFSSLQACAVSWLREEMVAACKAGGGKAGVGRFGSPDCLESLQYTMFPDLTHLDEMDEEAVGEYWMQNAPLLLQVANFALFLFGGDEYWRGLAPAGMAAAIEHRYVEPLLKAGRRLLAVVKEDGKKKGKGKEGEEEEGVGGLLELEVLVDVLARVPLM